MDAVEPRKPQQEPTDSASGWDDRFVLQAPTNNRSSTSTGVRALIPSGTARSWWYPRGGQNGLLHPFCRAARRRRRAPARQPQDRRPMSTLPSCTTGTRLTWASRSGQHAIKARSMPVAPRADALPRLECVPRLGVVEHRLAEKADGQAHRLRDVLAFPDQPLGSRGGRSAGLRGTTCTGGDTRAPCSAPCPTVGSIGRRGVCRGGSGTTCRGVAYWVHHALDEIAAIAISERTVRDSLHRSRRLLARGLMVCAVLWRHNEARIRVPTT